MESLRLLPWIYNASTVEQNIIIDDPQQLFPTVKSANERISRDDEKELVNKFAPQLQLSLFSRRKECGCRSSCLSRISA